MCFVPNHVNYDGGSSSVPSGKTTSEIAADPVVAWSLLRDPDCWVHLMPGYVSHETEDSETYRFTIQRNLGILTKSVIAEVRVIEEDEQQQRAAFTMRGLNEAFEGRGEVRLEPHANGARLDITFSIRAQGSMAPMINPVLGQQIPKVMEAFAVRLANWTEKEIGGR